MNWKTLLLFLLIAVLGAFIYLKAQVLGSENSKFNLTTRYTLGKYPLARAIFGLHKDGDARGWFLKSRGPLAVEVVRPYGLELREGVLQEFVSRVEKYTGQQVQLFDSETIKPGTLSQAEIAEIVKSKRRNYLPNRPSLFVIYAEDFAGGEKQVGQTYREDVVILSHNKLADLVADYRGALDDYIQSTLLHEFGHQLGLDHNDSPNCIMNKEVESPQRSWTFSGEGTPRDFCPQERQQLENIKAVLK